MLEAARIPRYGELSGPPDRSERVFRMNAGWYYATRENKALGPYASEGEADDAGDVFAQFAMVSDKASVAGYIDFMSRRLKVA